MWIKSFFLRRPDVKNYHNGVGGGTIIMDMKARLAEKQKKRRKKKGEKKGEKKHTHKIEYHSLGGEQLPPPPPPTPHGAATVCVCLYQVLVLRCFLLYLRFSFLTDYMHPICVYKYTLPRTHTYTHTPSTHTYTHTPYTHTHTHTHSNPHPHTHTHTDTCTSPTKKQTTNEY